MIVSDFVLSPDTSHIFPILAVFPLVPWLGWRTIAFSFYAVFTFLGFDLLNTWLVSKKPQSLLSLSKSFYQLFFELPITTRSCNSGVLKSDLYSHLPSINIAVRLATTSCRECYHHQLSFLQTYHRHDALLIKFPDPRELHKDALLLLPTAAPFTYIYVTTTTAFQDVFRLPNIWSVTSSVVVKDTFTRLNFVLWGCDGVRAPFVSISQRISRWN